MGIISRIIIVIVGSMSKHNIGFQVLISVSILSFGFAVAFAVAIHSCKTVGRTEKELDSQTCNISKK